MTTKCPFWPFSDAAALYRKNLYTYIQIMFSVTNFHFQKSIRKNRFFGLCFYFFSNRLLKTQKKINLDHDGLKTISYA